MTNSIEPPIVITSEEHGIDVMAQTLSTIQLSQKKAKGKPLVGMMYLKFNTQKDADKWLKQFEYIANEFWKDKCGGQEPLHIQAVSTKDALNVLDVLFAQDKETLRMLVKQRFPGM
jgi:hypothetical protein